MINELFVLLLTCCNTDMEIKLIAVEKQTLLTVSQQNISELCLASGEGKSVPFLRIGLLGGGGGGGYITSRTWTPMNGLVIGALAA
jgi:hypothetical protein